MKRILPLALSLLLAQQAWAKSATTAAPANIYHMVDSVMQAIPKSQTNYTKDVAAYINAHFTTESEKVRAAFIFTAATFEYDVPNMYAINFYETEQEKIDKIMKLRKGICANYAAVFHDICQKCGITSYVIGGYTRQNGQTGDLAHAWCAAVIDGEHFIFDPTWGSGYVNGKQFTRRINNEFFMCKPAAIIESHLPFDPMWQMLHYPVTAEEFAEGNTKIDKTKPFFSYPDSIAAHEKLSHLQQYEDEARRIEQNGVKTTITFNYLAMLRRNIEVAKQAELVSNYNEAVSGFNACIKNLNNFINYRNKQFTPTKPDAAIQAMIDTVETGMATVESKINSVKGKDARIDEMIGPFMENFADAGKTLAEHKEFVKKYLSKSKLTRKSMFYKQL